MRKSVDSALKQSYFEAQENVAQSWEDRHPPYLCGKSSMALSCRNSLEVPGNNSVGMDGNPPPPTEGFSSNEWGAPSWGFHDRDWRPAWGGQVLLGISEPACRNAYTCLKGTFLETTNFCLSKWRQWASGRQIHRLERPRDFLVILLLLYRL